MTSDFAISRQHEAAGRKVLTVDTQKATYQGKKWATLSDFQKRKLENLVFLNNAKDRPKIIYK
jgi:hypothetical protein